jgi:hypothetical protein
MGGSWSTIDVRPRTAVVYSKAVGEPGPNQTATIRHIDTPNELVISPI